MSFWDSLLKAFGSNAIGPTGGYLVPQRYKKAAKRNGGSRSLKAQSARYTGQAKLYRKQQANKQLTPNRKKARKANFTGGPAGSLSSMGEDGGYGGGDMSAAMDQIAQMTAPSVEVPQIDVEATLRRLFDPQFKAISDEESRTKSTGKKNTAEIQAAYKALERSISEDDAKEIKASYKEAAGANERTGQAVSNSINNAMKTQAEERRKDAQNLGIETALAQNSGAQQELAEGVADTGKATKAQNERLSELKAADEVLNRDAAQSARFSGNEAEATLKAQITDVLAGLATRRLDTKTAQANKRLDLETQNQNAVNAAKEMQAREQQAMLNSQVGMMKNAQDLQLQDAKMRNEADIERAKLANQRYIQDSKADTSRYKVDAGADGKGGGTILQQMISLRPGGLGAKSLQGVMANMDSFYGSGKGTWNDAFRQYQKRYKNSQRSLDAAKEYMRLMNKR